MKDGPDFEKSIESDDIQTRVIAAIADAADLEPARIELDDDIFVDLGVDSLGAVTVFVLLADDFGVREPTDEDEIRGLNTARKLADFVRAELA
ncbi:acyl carrier protein [Roseivivax lentus]|uniref:Acyl carrier protein n=1 Tax=Roseivivax lentus TaxID=633194 RepID=A0A1N7NYL5_9RHOB|nr:acyl carrier protein [Roseivivax lentus]SIT03455.1 acyl carrier protein [Roseivivax lentus]